MAPQELDSLSGCFNISYDDHFFILQSERNRSEDREGMKPAEDHG